VDQGGEMLGKGWDGTEMVLGAPNTLPESFTKFGCQKTVFVSFYRKSAGVLHDVQDFYRMFCNSSTGCFEMGFWSMDGGKKMEE